MVNVVVVAVVAVVGYVAYLLYENTIAKPLRAKAHFEKQGIFVTPFKWLIGDFGEVRKAASEDRLVELSLEGAKTRGYVHMIFAGPFPLLIMNDPDYLREIFGPKKAPYYHKGKEEDKDILRPLQGNGLLLSEDEYWNKQRKLMSPAFHYVCLNDMVPMMVSAAEAVCERWAKQVEASGTKVAEIDVTKDLNKLSLDVISTAAFGAAFKEDVVKAETFTRAQKAVLDAIQERTLNLSGFLPVIKQLPLKSKKVIDENCAVIRAMVKDIVKDRIEGRTQPGGGRKDLLQLMLDARDEDGQPMPPHAVEEESMNLITAGAETTSNLMDWMFYRMVIEPDVWVKCAAEVRRELKGELPTPESLKKLVYLEAVVYESLRLHPPAPMIPKVSMETHDIVADGKAITIPAGTILSINANVVHRHPKHWDSPETFRPERFLSARETDDGDARVADEEGKKNKARHPFVFLGFSAGPRKCLGKNFAMLEIKVMAAVVLQRFEFTLAPGQIIKSDPITRLPTNGIVMRTSKANQQQAYADDAHTRFEPVRPVGMI